MTVPTLEKAIESIDILNSVKPGNVNEASDFLIQLQQSNFAWFIADQLLYMNKDIYSSYFGAQTMRTKIQLHFDELPVDSHMSLKQSLLKHLLATNSTTSPTVSKQLCLAVADLFCHMVQWPNSLQEIIETLSHSIESVCLLMDVLTYIPEEFANKSLRLGVNRKTQIFGDLEEQRLAVISVIERTISLSTDAALIGALRCLDSWFIINVFRDTDLNQSPLIPLVYDVLENPNNVVESLFKAAAQCASTFCHNIHRTPGLMQMFQLRTYNLKNAYRLCESSRPDFCLEYAKIFCDMTSALLPAVLAYPRFDNSCDPSDVRSLHMLILAAGTNRECCTFVLDVLTDVCDHSDGSTPEQARTQLAPIFEEIIAAITRHCAMSDAKDEPSLADFRSDVFYVMEQIRMFVDVESLFRKMLGSLSELLSRGAEGNSMNEAEAVLCIISSLFKFVDTDSAENAHWTEQLLVAVILPNVGRSQASFQSVCFTMFGELWSWACQRPQIMDCMFREMATFVTVTDFDESDDLQLGALDSALRALSSVAKRQPCYIVEPDKWHLVVALCDRLPRLKFVPRAMVDFYEALGRTFSVPRHAATLAELRQSPEQLAQKLWQLTQLNLDVVNSLVTSNTQCKAPKDPHNPCVWLDNVSALFVSMARLVTGTDSADKSDTLDTLRQPYVTALYCVFEQCLWPLVAGLIDCFIDDGHLLERVVRIVRYAQRSFQTLTKPLLGSIAQKIVAAYGQSKESCFIYIGGILVDEFGQDVECRHGLIGMFHALSVPALEVLRGHGLDNNPHTTEDLFRLMVRLVQHCSSDFLAWEALELDQLLDMAVRTLSGSKIDAKMLGLRFLVETLDCANKEAHLAVRNRALSWLLGDGLTRLLESALHLCRWNSDEVLDEDLGSDMADIVVHVRKLVDPARFLGALDGALVQVGVSRKDGLLYATNEQIVRFRDALQHDKRVLRGLEDFARLFS